MFIAVTQRVDYLTNRNETRDSLDQELSKFLLSNQLIPVLIPNSMAKLGKLETLLASVKVTGVCLSGGNELNEFEERDRTELFLLDYAEREKLPVLGICKGMQMMAIREGATLKSVQGHVRTRHQLEGEFNFEVNSYHNNSIESCPKNYTVIARSKDGCIEAIRHKFFPWEGWMWHPEREKIFQPTDCKGIKRIFFESE